MATTTTTNLGLIKPDYDEAADVEVLNQNADKIDAACGKYQSALAIVANGNTHGAVAKGQYVYVRGHGTLAEGLYTAKSAIAVNATLSGANLTADSGGGLNSLGIAMSSVEEKTLGNFLGSRSVSNPDFNNLVDPGVWFIGDMATATNSPGSIGWVTMLVLAYGGTIVQVIFGGRQSSEAKTRIWVRYRYQNEWKPWYYTQMQAV